VHGQHSYHAHTRIHELQRTYVGFTQCVHWLATQQVLAEIKQRCERGPDRGTFFTEWFKENPGATLKESFTALVEEGYASYDLDTLKPIYAEIEVALDTLMKEWREKVVAALKNGTEVPAAKDFQIAVEDVYKAQVRVKFPHPGGAAYVESVGKMLTNAAPEAPIILLCVGLLDTKNGVGAVDILPHVVDSDQLGASFANIPTCELLYVLFKSLHMNATNVAVAVVENAGMAEDKQTKNGSTFQPWDRPASWVKVIARLE
jgi:hypothetical protein